MAYARKRIGKDGKPRYTGCYLDLQGRERSAGTFGEKRRAERAAQEAEFRQREGRVGDPKRGKQRFREYVVGTWFPHHVVEAKTRETYRYNLHAHILPWFGTTRMSEIMPGDVREWVTDQVNRGMSPQTIDKNMTILSAIFTTALNDQITFLHPCKGVKIPVAPKKPLRIITSEQFDAIYQNVKVVSLQLLVELDIESGMRWGEITEMRPRDLDFANSIVTVSRAVVEVTPEDRRNQAVMATHDFPAAR
ncbi:site-specific integrase [Pseudofrankia sp. DC12]|uniref:site-specific integrase n=1 Tax=Pseudofrankia sp. DC12 TaxID=683315 RepID=UPI000A02E679|nr:site-specific integrase [Pseudofrankia sp. DC12]